MRKKFLAILATGTLLIFGLLAAQPATADTPQPDPNIVVWSVPKPCTDSSPFACGPQQFVGFLGDPSLVYLCETWYQVDTYKSGHPFGTTVFELTANGTPGGDQAWIKSWFFEYGGECPPPPQPDDETSRSVDTTVECKGDVTVITTTDTTTRTPYVWDEDTKRWVAGETEVSTEVTVSTKEGPDCTPEAPTPPPVPAQPAFTG